MKLSKMCVKHPCIPILGSPVKESPGGTNTHNVATGRLDEEALDWTKLGRSSPDRWGETHSKESSRGLFPLVNLMCCCVPTVLQSSFSTKRSRCSLTYSISIERPNIAVVSVF